MALHVFDSVIYGNDFGSETVKNIFSEESIVQDWIDFEVVLAQVQGDMGVIPKEAAAEIRDKGSINYVTIKRVGEIYSQTMLSSVAMIRAFKEACDKEYGEYIHYGATTQDCFDTTLACRMKKTLAYFEQTLKDIRQILNQMARQYRSAVMAGVTHGQHALPVTFGFTAAIWSEMVDGHIQRIREAKKRILVGSVSGAVGNFASFAKIGVKDCLEMERRVLEHFGLHQPDISIQPRIERLAEFLQIQALISNSFQKIADELFLNQRNEFSITEEPFDTAKQISSSTMPQKRNPNRCEMIKALSKKIRSNSNAFSEIQMRDYRDHSPFYLEDLVIPETCILTSAVLEQAKYILKGLKVNKGNLRKNLEITNGQILSENMMLTLSTKTGKKETGMMIVHKASMESFEKGIPFDQYIRNQPEVHRYLSRDEIDDVLKPENYLGLCDVLIDRILEKNEQK